MKAIIKATELIDVLSTHGAIITESDADLILGYFEGHGCEIRINEDGALFTGYVVEDDDEFFESDFNEIMDRVSIWNEELISEYEELVQYKDGYEKDLENYKADEPIIDKLYLMRF